MKAYNAGALSRTGLFRCREVGKAC